MTDGEDESGDGDGDGETGEEPALDPESLEARLEDATEALAAAETEADLDEVEETIDAVESDLEAADLPEPDDEDEDEEGPRDELENRLSDLREDLEAARGPYAEDVVEAVETARSTIEETRWTGDGRDAVERAVNELRAAVGDRLDAEFGTVEGDPDALAAALEDAVEAVEDAGLDPDDDAEVIATLVEATDELSAALEDAEEWDDLQTHEQLRAEGYYDVLGHFKDYPVEWAALKEHEKRGNVDMVLLALEQLGSEFMEDHCLEALTRMGRLNGEATFEVMHDRAGKRDRPGIEVLGKMAAEDAVDTLVEYVDTDSDPQLQKVTFKALGEIGSREATQALANKLEMDNDNVRPYAARALGLIGDTRAVDPLAETLSTDDSDNVRTAAAWALRQIGTEAALEAAAEYVDDRAYTVQAEAEKAAEALEAGDADAESAPTA